MIGSMQKMSDFSMVMAERCKNSGVPDSDVAQIVADNGDNSEAMEYALAKAWTKQVLDNMRGRKE